MKSLIAVIFFFFVFNNIYAQHVAKSKLDTISNTEHRLSDHATVFNDNPLFVIDDKIIANSSINRELKNLNNVNNISFLKGPEAIALYGRDGVHGVILIRTDNSKANVTNIESAQNESSKMKLKFKIASWSELNKKYNSPLFVLDGVVLDSAKLNSVDLNEILDINILQYPPGTIADVNRTGDVVVINTKKSAKIKYQKKLSELSNDYRLGLESHKNIDNNFLYVIDGVPIQGLPDHITYTLYQLSADKISSVSYIEKGILGDDSMLSPMVIINLKQ